MTTTTVRGLLAVAAISAALGAVPGGAAAFEAPATTTAQAVLGADASGPNYRVDPEVRSDGLMHLFVLHTAYGSFDIAGDDLMRTRIRELGALRKLGAMSESEVFAKSLARTAAAPLEFGADLIKDPGATLKKSASGVANMFGRIGASIENRSNNRDNVVTSVLGVDSARRALAVQMDVDPYTDFAPLSEKLGEVASASAFGGLTMKGLMMIIPGGAGVAVSSASTADTIRGTLSEKTSAQVIEIVLGKLGKAGVPASVAGQLVHNRSYSPADLLIMAEALTALKAGKSSLFVSRAAMAATREEAVFQRRRAQLLAQNAKEMGIGAFVDVGGFPLNRTKDGRLLALFPFDEVSWTPRVADGFARMAAAAAGETSPPLIALTGTATPMAQKEIAAKGWTLTRLR
jgi:hypothetical protein